MLTKKPESGKRWIFPLNNCAEEEEMALQEVPGCAHMAHGRKMGENGTPNLQGFVTFKAMKRLSAMQKINDRAHFQN